MNKNKYYCTGQALTISMVEITANSAEEAEAVMQRFVDKIAEVMKDEVRWDEADWSIEENILDEATGEWHSAEIAFGMDEATYEMSDVEADADTLASAGYGTDEDYA